MSEGKDMGITGIPSMGMCQKCKTRPATLYWAENHLSLIHGFSEEWCEVCATTAQLEYAKDLADKIPSLEAKLEKLLEGENV